MLSAGDSLQLQWHIYPEGEGWKLMLQADGNQKRAGGSYIYIRQNGCESKSVTRDNESHSIMIKESLYQKDIAIVIMCVLKM